MAAAAMNRTYLEILREIFPRTNEHMIQNIIEIVERENPNDVFEGKIENMINLLSGDGAAGPMPNVDNVSNSLFSNLTSIFPDVDEDYLHEYVAYKPPFYDIEDAIGELSMRDLPTKNPDPTIITEQLKAALPNADPSYLHNEACRLAKLPLHQEALDEFLGTAIRDHNYPTMQDYLKNKKHKEEVATYKDNFNLQKFLQTFPDPIETFTGKNRLSGLDDNSTDSDEKYALNFLYNSYTRIRRKYIDLVFKYEKKDLVAVCNRLDKLHNSLLRPRPAENEAEDSTNVTLLQMISFLKYRKQIERELKLKNEAYRHAKEEARKFNLFETCQCCFDDELIPEEIYFCMRGCSFCKDCVKKGVEVGVGKGDTRFLCMADCDSEFSLQTLQMVLPNKLFERLAQKIASEEIRKANVDGLEVCPFCDFATILPDEDKIFKCENPECLKESCRQCKHESHVPKRCNEIEYDEDVRRRTYIENKMTEALTRTCVNCKKSFVKSNGCNKMTCVCGAKMCYLCGEAVNDYSHFREGGRCPLFTNDVQINLQRVIKGAQQAKSDLGDVEIKFDPALNIQEFFF
ncbi:E3 ubiquitin-protein ligase RNF216-like [Diabrotica virgifera virgifera]|uniref:E3 ubiquitin-protein ligase RNF216-like n=1 Tax=Diabrotica virgifera virgifera TaxID=50390 RepID=A0A6P7HBZ2_DIAVI|nr:E3 ubiquitin-protein ligase RNF216-like [Diabrotica virgifera virgifera]XP_050507734.1 E3 ubiquitin-protein ligase RNF216-like [Diabrotica virgifera virgifera]XP_050507735.1 E3 ubiquitin-protein ligase RNF216-like [Diabrotica virgifera virgifera]XP_050507736.1 E3 ubiquitin-protein ligase RNF216-like [Diabrotica virgifera virgifera]